MNQENQIEQELYYDLVEGAPDAIIALDKIGNFIAFNTMAQRISLFTKEDVMGKHFAKINILAKRSIPKALQEFAFALAGKERLPFELTILRKDGSTVTLEALPRLVKNSKRGGIWISVIMRDISARKEVERKSRAYLDEIEKLNKFMVGREMRMVELKGEIKQLKEKLGES